MALPWLIGAAAAALVAAALSSDSDEDYEDYDNDNEDSERREAEIERKEHQRQEKIKALEASYRERLKFDAKKMTNLLSSMAEVDNVQESMVVIGRVSGIETSSDSGYKDLLTQHIVKNKKTLDKFHSNVAFFEKLYNGHVEAKKEVVQISEAIDNLEKQAKKIDSLIKKLS